MLAVKPYWDVLYSDLYLLLQLHAASCFHYDIYLWDIRRRSELLGELYPRVLILTVKHSIQRYEVVALTFDFTKDDNEQDDYQRLNNSRDNEDMDNFF